MLDDIYKSLDSDSVFQDIAMSFKKSSRLGHRIPQ